MEDEYNGLKVDEHKDLKIEAAMEMVGQYQVIRLVYNYSVVQFDSMDVDLR